MMVGALVERMVGGLADMWVKMMVVLMVAH